MYLPIYLGGDGFCGRDGHSSTNLFGREVKFIIYLTLERDGRSSTHQHLPFHLAGDGHSPTHEFGRDLEFVYLLIDLEGEGHKSTHQYGRG